MKTYRLHLLRHGATDANERGLYVGSTDLPLSPAGVSELLRLKDSCRYPGAARFFSSPMTRCRQTMQVLYPGVQPELLPGLTECHFGEWEGQSLAQLRTREDFLRWMENSSAPIPGGEEPAAFQQRVRDAFEALVRRLLTDGVTDAVVCTHGGVIMLLMAAYALPRQELRAWTSPPGGGFTLRITPSVWMREPVAEAVAALPAAMDGDGRAPRDEE